LAAIKRKEEKPEKQLGKLQQQLNGVRAAAKALGRSAERDATIVKEARVIGCPRSGKRQGGEKARGRRPGPQPKLVVT
jgi:hypothetical protein